MGLAALAIASATVSSIFCIALANYSPEDKPQMNTDDARIRILSASSAANFHFEAKRARSQTSTYPVRAHPRRNF